MVDPRTATTTQPRLRFNFDKAKQSGASDEDILEFLQSRDTNIDWGELETRSQGYQNPLAYKISTLAQNDWEFLPPKPQEATPPSPSLESTPPSPTQEDFTPTLDKLENESALREIYRDLAPSFMLTKEMEQDNTTLQKAIDEAKEQGRAFSDLHPSLKQALRKRAHQEKSVFTNPLATPHDLALESYEKDLRDLHIAKKTPQELDQSDKDYIKSRASAWDKIFASDDEIYRDFIENKRAQKIVPKEMKTALEVLDNFHQYKSIASLLTGSDEKAKTDYLNSAHTIATNLGFEGIGVNDKGELFLNHKGEFYRINSGFFESLPTILAANAGSITGGIAGAFAGAARGAKLGRAGGGYGATAGAVVGGAVGAFGGGALDTILGNAYLHRETNAQEILAHATQEGVLNIVGDMAILGAIKAYDKLKGAGIAQSLGKIIDYTPVLGFVKRSQDGNQAMAQKLLSQTYTKEQEKSLQEASENFGLALEIGDRTKRIDTTNLPPKFKDAVDKVQDIFTLKNQQQFQSRLLQAIRADESGNLLGFITEAASKSPKAHNTLTRILHQTTQKLKRSLESIAPKSSLKAIFDELEKGTKDSYDEAITQILGTIYDDTYKVNLNTLKEQSGSPSFEAFKQSLADSGVAPESSANFLNFIEKNIYNPKGVSFTQLNNALKNLNAYYKNERDPNFKTHIKQAYDSFVRSDIKAGIESIFTQNKVAYNDAKTLFDTALLDYATMKDSLKLADRLKIRDRKNTNEKALQSLLDFAKGQGDKEANLDAITKALPQGARAHIEIAMLEELFRKSMLEVRDIQVFNSTKFLENIKELKGTFTSKAAHDYINAAEKFHALFKNDPLILQAIKPATTDKIGSSIATTLEGAVKFQVIKGIFANMIRLLPHIPLLPSVNQKVQGAALRHHLSKALESSYNIGDLKLELARLEKRGDFTNATKEHIRAFKGELDNARQEVLDIAKSPHALESTAQAQPSSRADEIGVAIHKEAPQETQKVDSSVAYTDTQGHTHQIPTDIAQKWLDSFGLKDLQESYTPKFSEQVAQALEPILQGDQINLSANSLVKLIQRDRAEFLPYIKETLEQSDIIIKDKENAIIFAKDIGQQSYFTSVSKNDKGEWVISTNSYKTLSQLKNRVSESGEVLYLSKEAPNILAETFTTKAFSNELASEIIPQAPQTPTTQRLMQQAKQEALAKQNEIAEQAKAKELAEQQTAQAIKDHNDQIQAQKDARVGKGEMDRDIHIGDPIEVRKTNAPSTSIATDDDNIYQLDFVIVKASDVKPNFSSDGLQPRTQKEHKTIESIAQNFKPEMVLGRGGYKDLPIIAKDGQVITGNHRVQGFKDFTQESRAAYEKAIKDRFGIELADDELLLRMPTKDLSTKELLSIAYNSNKEDIKNLGDHIYSVLGRYAPNFDKLPRQLESSSVQELKSKIAKILDPSPYPNENDTNLALLAHTIKADKNANITEMLNAFSKLDKEDADKTLQTFTDTAGLWHILSNNAVEYGLKQLDLRPYLLGAMYKAATSLHTTRAANFKELNKQIKHIIDTTDASGTNMMLEMMPNTYDNLIADLLGASLARFMRLENPSGSLYESLRNTHKGLEAQLAPRIDFFSETGFTQGKNISQADIFDFIEYMIKQGEAGSEVAQAVELLPKLREKYTAFKGEDSALGLESQAGKHNDPTTPADTPKVDSTLSQEIKDIIDSSPAKGRDMQIIGEANFTPQVVEYAHKNNKKVAIDKLDKAEAEQLGFKHPSDVRVTIDYQAINHTLNRHGADSPLVQQSGQKAVDYTDIAEYRSIVKGADESLNSVDNMGLPVVVSYKQVNGHFVVVEEIRKGQNELSFKTMFKQEGEYKNSQSYKETSQSSNATEGYEPTANSFALTDEIIPHTLSKKQQEKLAQIDKQIAQSQKYLKEAQEKLADFESGKAIADYKERWARNLKEAEADYKEALKNANPSRLTEIKTLFDNQISELQWKLTDEGVQQFIRQNHPTKHIEYLKQELETLHATRQSTLESTPKAPKLPKITESYIKQTLENPTAVYETLDPQGKAALKEAFMEKFKAARENSKKWQDLRIILRNFETYDDSLALQQLKSQEALESTHDLQEQNAQALITLKESVQNGNRIYSVELEGLDHPSSVDRSPKSKGVENSHHDDAGATKAARLFENPSDIIPQAQQTKREYSELLPELEKYNAIAKEMKAKGDTTLTGSKEAFKVREILEALQEVISQTPQAKARAEQVAKEITQAYNDKLRTKINVYHKMPQKTQKQTEAKEARATEINTIREEILAPYRDEFEKFGWRAHDQLLVYPQRIYKDGKEIKLPIADDAKVLIGTHNEIYKLAPTLEKYARENPHDKNYASRLELFKDHEAQYAQQIAEQEKIVQEYFSHQGHNASTPTPQDTPKVDSTQNAQSVATPQAAKPTPPTQAQKIPEQDLPHHAEKELYKELESLKPLKRELTQLRESGEWRSKQGRARRKELDEKIKEAEARGITSTQIQTKNAKNYEKFLSKYGDMEYFKELAQASRDRYIQGLQKDIDNYDASKTTTTPNGIIFTKQSLENILESTREQELDIAGQIWSIAHSMVKLREGAIYKQTDEKIGEFYTKEREKIQKALGIKPIAEFGENYAEYYRDGVGAIEKLLGEKKGQVAGAFHREELGDIDLVWGEVTGSGKEAKGWGLAKIIEKHGDEFQDIAKELDEIIRDGEVVKRAGRDEAYNIEYNGFKVGINKGFNKQGENKWIVTAFDDSVEKTAKTAPASDSTKETDLSLNSSDIVAQDLQETPNADSNALLESTMKKFRYDEKKAKDLLEWHKDSSPLTKDENGLPKVFYHGSENQFETFDRDKTGLGYFFTEQRELAEPFKDDKNLMYPSFLKIKKVFDSANPTQAEWDAYKDFIIQRAGEQHKQAIEQHFKQWQKDLKSEGANPYTLPTFFLWKELERLGVELESSGRISFLNYGSELENKKLVEFLQSRGYDAMTHTMHMRGYDSKVLSVFNPNQIKHIENRGIESEQGHKYFNESSPNIFHSNPHLGAGLLGGSVAGVEQDENGQWRFSPEKFALGLLGGTAGSKAVAKGLEWRAKKVAKSYPNIAKDNPQLMQEIAKRDLHTYATASTHNALTRFLHNNKLFDINPQLFAGEKALANEAYAPHKARLERAKELEAKGANEIEIWEQTGWYKDKDQRWKFEISQSGGELDIPKLEKARQVELGEILQDKELFNAYPQLKTLVIKNDKTLEAFGQYMPEYNGKSKHLSINLGEIATTHHTPKEVLYHELQHAIQDIEGFAYGRNYYRQAKEYFDLHGEVEARNVQARLMQDDALARAEKNLLQTRQELEKTKKEYDNILAEYKKVFDNPITAEKLANDRIHSLQEHIYKQEQNIHNLKTLGEKGFLQAHPHKTMDTSIYDTNAEATMMGEALSKKLGAKAGDTLKSTQKVQGESKEMQQQLQSTIQTHLENLPPNPTPQPINEAKIKALIKRFDNIENLQEHLNTRADTKARQEIFSLLDDTLQTPQVHYKKDGKDKYLKRYKSERKEPYFYLLVTKDENKTFITHFKTRDSKYLSKEITKAQEIIQGADIIEALSQRTGDI